MSNPIARLLGEAETTLAGFSRRTVASIADPIKAKGQEIVADVGGAASRAVKVIVVKAVLGLVAGVMAIIAIVYAVAALYVYLLPIIGPVESRLAIAGLFLLIAVIAVLAMVFWPTGAPPPGKRVAARAESATAQVQRAVDETTVARETSDDPSTIGPQPVDLKGGVEMLAGILGDAGFRREQAGLRTGMALASQLKPMQIVSIALVGGYVAGLRYVARRR